MKRFIPFLLVAASFAANAQELYKCDTTKSFWVFSQDNSYLYIKLLGKVTPTEQSTIVAVNDYPLQSLIVDKATFIKKDEGNSDLDILVRYAMSEGEYMSGVFKRKVNIKMQRAPLKDRDVLIWSFEMPLEAHQQVKAQLFANVIIDDKVFGLASPQFNEQKYNAVKDALMTVIGTLQKAKNKEHIDALCLH